MNTDYLVRRVCPYLRGAPDECLGCPATEDSSYGPGTRACRSLAESVIGIVSASQADTIESLQRELAEAVGDIAKLKQSLAAEVTESERLRGEPYVRHKRRDWRYVPALVWAVTPVILYFCLLAYLFIFV